MWECRCDCGNVVAVRSSSLFSGNTMSCGCLQKERGPKIKDLTGQRFGRLVALKPMKERKSAYVMWECQCDCGNKVQARSSSLASGNSLSCGCLQREIVSQSQTKDLTGQRFGKLIVLRPTDMRKGSHVVWECKCDCGNTIYTIGQKLTKGITTSCGCLRKEKTIQPPKRDLTGQRFGKLVVLRSMAERKNGYIMWECKCDCGNVVQVRSSKLISGDKMSCGCTTRELLIKSHTIDITGQRFGRLVALKPTEERRRGLVVWECQCDCGKTVFLDGRALRNGKTVSCGCL